MARLAILLALTCATPVHSTCGPTCDSWCNAEPSPESISCFHPNPSECSGDFCCITCESWQRYIATDTPSCSCEEFGGHCYANNCVPCADECLPGSLKDHDGPLGTGLLCVAGQETKAGGCEPCCQASHTAAGCQLECPCNNPASDCPSPSNTTSKPGDMRNFELPTPNLRGGTCFGKPEQCASFCDSFNRPCDKTSLGADGPVVWCCNI
jgi:hypothetical protein